MSGARAMLQLATMVVALCYFCCAIETAQLDWMADYNKALKLVQPNQLELAEYFGQRVGKNRQYDHELRLLSFLYPNVELARVRNYLDSFTQLKQVGDADALIETLKWSNSSITDQELANVATVNLHLGQLLAPACDAYVRQLGPAVFDSAQFKQLELSGQLEADMEAIDAAGSQKAAALRDFIRGWTYYQACKLLIAGNTGELVRRATVRVDDRARLLKRKRAE